MMSKTVRSAVVVAMIGAATLASMGIADAAPLDATDEQQIIDYLTEVMRDFDAAARPPDPFTRSKAPQELEIATTTYASGRTRTVVAKVYRRMAGAHPSTWYRSFSYRDADRLTFDALFRPGATPLPVIASIIARELSIELGQPVPVGLDPATYRNFALTDDAVLFFFDQQQLPPGSPATEVSVPRAAIATMLAPGL